MTRDIEVIRRRALALIELASEWGIIVTIKTKSDKPLAMGNTYMHLDVREARELDPVTLAMIEDHNQALEDAQRAEEDDEEDWSCSRCGGPMHRTANHLHNQCGDCGFTERVEREAP